MEETAVTFMLSEAELERLDMTCRGGEGCCGREPGRQCGEGEGDCDDDGQCQGLLQCGSDNCQTKSGGAWDQTDDCCQEIYPHTSLYIHRPYSVDVMITHYKMAGDHNVHVSIDLGHTVRR